MPLSSAGTRRRDYRTLRLRSHFSATDSPSTTYFADLTGRQITASGSHPVSQLRADGPDLGGPFFTTKSYVKQSAKHFTMNRTMSGLNIANVMQTRTNLGPVIAYVPPLDNGSRFPKSIHSSDEKLSQLGATAIASVNPGSPPAEASTFLGEILREGVPSIPIINSWKKKTALAQAIGSEYLNVVFGWQPMIKDIDDMTKVMKHANKVLAQYERDANKVVRRRFVFPIIQSRKETDLGLANPHGLHGSFLYSGGRLTRVVEETTRRWFSGAFTYSLPSGYDSRNAMNRAALLAKLLGAEISPETVWNLAPWSWAFDWVSNAGDVLTNISRFAVDGQVLRYGYMMEHTIVSHTYKLDGVRLRTPQDIRGIGSAGATINVPSISYVTETKKRIASGPYGFGLSWDGLSSFQQSVLLALGISRR